MLVSDLLNTLRKFDALRDGEAGGDLVKCRVLERIPPDYAEESAPSRKYPQDFCEFRSQSRTASPVSAELTMASSTSMLWTFSSSEMMYDSSPRMAAAKF